MADNPDPQSDRIGNDFREGPNPSPGGTIEPEAELPPYKGRTTGSDDPSGLGASVERQLAETKSGAIGQTASPAVESPVSDDEVTDEVPESPKNVGVSTHRGGEQVAKHEGKEAGRHEGPTEHESQRPTGYSDERDDSAMEE